MLPSYRSYDMFTWLILACWLSKMLSSSMIKVFGRPPVATLALFWHKLKLSRAKYGYYLGPSLILQSQLNSITCITHLGVTCLFVCILKPNYAFMHMHTHVHACPLKLAWWWRFKMVETRALLLPAKALSIKTCLVIWPSYGLGLVIDRTLYSKVFKKQSPPCKEMQPW